MIIEALEVEKGTKRHVPPVQEDIALSNCSPLRMSECLTEDEGDSTVELRPELCGESLSRSGVPGLDVAVPSPLFLWLCIDPLENINPFCFIEPLRKNEKKSNKNKSFFPSLSPSTSKLHHKFLFLLYLS